jgi:hypothetical protein
MRKKSTLLIPQSLQQSAIGTASARKSMKNEVTFDDRGVQKSTSAVPAVMVSSDILTVQEVAMELRCSKAHVCNVINGKVKKVPRLPCISLGRRKLIRRATFELWKQANEQGLDDMILGSGKGAVVDAWEEDSHA